MRAARAAATPRVCRHRACAARPSRAVCVIHGRHIDAHTDTNGHLYTYIYPYDADGARRRCRAAHGSAGGRRMGGHGHGRVLKGYSTTGTQKGVRTKRARKRGTQQGTQKGTQKGVSKGGLEKGAQKRVLKIGYYKTGTQRGTQKGCSKGGTQKGVLKKGYSNRVLEFGQSNRVLKKGFSKRGTQKRGT